MYENQSNPAKFELYADPHTGEARLRPVELPRPAKTPNTPGLTVDSKLAVRILRLGPLGYERPSAEANPGIRD